MTAPEGDLPRMPRMLLVAAAASKVGKTEFARRMIQKLAARMDVVGVKVTTIREVGGPCPRCKDGCGVCSSLAGDFEILAQGPETPSTKDTGKLLAAGARPVYWVRAFRAHLPAAAAALGGRLGPDAVVVCESSSLRLVGVPDYFVMLRPPGRDLKPSSAEVKRYVDRFVSPEPQSLERALHEIDYVQGKWRAREPATLIVLAGGRSARMGRDKSLLPVGGKPMIQHIVERLGPHFEQVLISADEPGKYRFLETPVIPDGVRGQGPIAGMVAALQAARNDLTMVVACDIPNVAGTFAERLLWEAEGVDAVVPTADGYLEPLCAVYRRSAIPVARAALARGEHRIRSLYEQLRTRLVETGRAERLLNLNTPAEYEAYRNTGDPPARGAAAASLLSAPDAAPKSSSSS